MDRASAQMTGRAVIIAGTSLGSAGAGVIVGVGLLLAVGTGCGSGAGACHDDVPPLSSMFYEGGSSCTLPDGRPGLGDGQYGCIDPTVCHCRPEAVPATCSASAVCVYQGCSGANQGAACALPGGAQGTCCESVCSAVDLGTDPSNCGGCGNVCPAGMPCDNGQCGVPFGSGTVACPSGLVAAEAATTNSATVACVAVSCAGLADGAPCSTQVDAGGAVSPAGPMAGLCCHGACVAWYKDNENCGGCGITCCPGTSCGVANDFGGVVSSFGIVGWCL